FIAWLLPLGEDPQKQKTARWKKIGRAVFGEKPRAAVVLYCGERHSLLDDFREEKWVNVFGYQAITDMTDNALKTAFSPPFNEEWKREPARPLIAFAPYENGLADQSQHRF